MSDKLLGRTKKLTWAILLVCIIGLIFMPVLPWVITETTVIEKDYAGEITSESTKTAYLNEFSIDAAEKMLDMFKSLAAAFGGSDSSDMKTFNALEDMNGNLGLISLSFWLVVFFCIIVIAGIAFYNLEKQPFFSYILFLVGCIFVIFAILVLVSHVGIIGNIDDFPTVDSDNDEYLTETYKHSFGYNYVPLIMGIILMILSILYIVFVALPSVKAFSARLKQPKPAYQAYNPGGYQQMPPQQPMMQQSFQAPPPPPPVPEEPSKPKKKTKNPKFCTICGTSLTSDADFCPNCGKKLK